MSSDLFTVCLTTALQVNVNVHFLNRDLAQCSKPHACRDDGSVHCRVVAVTANDNALSPGYRSQLHLCRLRSGAVTFRHWWREGRLGAKLAAADESAQRLEESNETTSEVGAEHHVGQNHQDVACLLQHIRINSTTSLFEGEGEGGRSFVMVSACPAVCLWLPPLPPPKKKKKKGGGGGSWPLWKRDIWNFVSWSLVSSCLLFLVFSVTLTLLTALSSQKSL